jgi:hypothetical protein
MNLLSRENGMKNSALISCLFASSIVCLLPGVSHGAETPAVTFLPDQGIMYGDPLANSNHGWKFSPIADIRVTELGLYDYNSDGLLGSHPIGVWDQSGHLLASTVMDAWQILPLSNNCRWKDIEDIVLTQDQEYTISFYSSNISHADFQINSYSSVQFTSSITYITALYGGTSFARPTNTTSLARVGPNFSFVVVPEPATISLLFIAGLSAMTRLERKYKRS